MIAAMLKMMDARIAQHNLVATADSDRVGSPIAPVSTQAEITTAPSSITAAFISL
ncbi:hypothetical protein D3C87_2037420 [compost metagenome]